jgi:hypothetical protein
MLFNAQLLPNIQDCVNEFRSQGKQMFSTIDLIRLYLGRYNVDHTTPDKSWNANLGKFLHNNSVILGIQLIPPNENEVDDCGYRTSTAVWRIVNVIN